MGPRYISVQEYEPLKVDVVTAGEIRETLRDIGQRLQPRFGFLTETSRGMAIGNFVGSARLPSGAVIEVRPKVSAGSDWPSAVLDLLEPGSRIELQGNRQASFSFRRSNLQDALAIEFSRRLQLAFDREGPIQIIQMQFEESRRFKGKLDLSRWLRRSVLAPHIFPLTREEFSTRNDFASGIAFTANLLAKGTHHPIVSSQLYRLASLQVPGAPVPTHVSPGIALRQLPSQWKSYSPVWSLVQAILRNRALLNSTGQLHGLEVAVEPWPLLETYLSRALNSAAQQLSNGAAHYEFRTQHQVQVLSHLPGAPTSGINSLGKSALNAYPDGVLFRNGVPLANFDAKYTKFDETPEESHVYQVLAASAALQTRIAVLVYPEEFDAQWFKVTTLNGRPATLVAVGVGMFSYRRGKGDLEGASKLISLLKSPH